MTTLITEMLTDDTFSFPKCFQGKRNAKIIRTYKMVPSYNNPIWPQEEFHQPNFAITDYGGMIRTGWIRIHHNGLTEGSVIMQRTRLYKRVIINQAGTITEPNE
uniref:DUF1080 domain-containing protein n=1 Tax=Loa loa TaxID=7209 RepID=A0A1I7VFH2_LOALO